MKTRVGAPLTRVRLAPRSVLAVHAPLAPGDPLPYDVVDVFTGPDAPGNPLAVVHGAGGLTSAQLVELARGFGFSESAFPVPLGPTAYALRIATPDVELPFAGHTSVGAAWVLRERGDVTADVVEQRCAAGSVVLRHEPDGVCWLSGAAPTDRGAVPGENLLEAVGLGAEDLVAPAVVAGTGLDFGYLLVRPDAVGRVVADRASVTAGLTPLRERLGVPVAGIAVVGWPGSVTPEPLEVRMLADDIGDQAEDPATGSAALGLQVALAGLRLLPPGASRFTLHQGRYVGRASVLRCRAQVESATIVSAEVGGHVEPVSHGTVDAPPA